MQDLKWCRRATRQIAAQLRRFHIRTSASTVRRLLKKMGFSLRVNHKRLTVEPQSAPAAHPQPAVSLYRSPAKTIHGARPPHHQRGCQKRRSGWESSRILESAGNRSRNRCWTTISPATRWAGPFLMVFTIPARIADLWRWAPATKLPAFAVDVIALCRKTARTENVSAGPGAVSPGRRWGSNGVRPRAWKYHLQQQLVNAHGLKVTVCHYPLAPPNGIPLNIVCFPRSVTIGPADLWTYETVLKYIRTTKTQTGLQVNARLLRHLYKKVKRYPLSKCSNLS